MIMLRRMKAFTVLVLLLALLPGVRCQPCLNVPSCLCVFILNKATLSFESHANCTGAELSNIPAQLPHKLVYLDFTGNNLLPENVHSLCVFRSLTTISLSDNYLTDLPSGQLKNCSSIQSLTLTGNVFNFLSVDSFSGIENIISINGMEVRKVTASAFIKLTKLTYLSLTLHQSEIPAELLGGLKLKSLTVIIENALALPVTFLKSIGDTLKTLTVKSPSLQTLDADSLYGQSILEDITLEMDDIHTLPAELFQQMTTASTVRHVHISGVRSLPRAIFNSLTELLHLDLHEAEDMPADLFEGLLLLQHLNLSDCYIGFGQVPPGWFRDLWSLTTLNLQHTSIEVVEQVDFDGLESIEVLDISHNNIRTIKAGTFDHISDTLQELRLNNNMLGVITGNAFKGIRGLRTLDLSYNKVFELAHGLFFNLEKMEYLNLHENKLFDIGASSFKYLTNLHDLDLSYNIINVIPTELFSKTMSLENLNLAGNRVFILSYAFFESIHSLKSLNLDHNPITCSCNLMDMKERLLSTAIAGTCESNGVSYVISELEYQSGCKVSSITPPSTSKLVSSTGADSTVVTTTMSTSTLHPTHSNTLTHTKVTTLKSVSIQSTHPYGGHGLSKIIDDPLSKIHVENKDKTTPSDYTQSNTNNGTENVSAIHKAPGVTGNDDGVQLNVNTSENKQKISFLNKTVIGTPEFSFEGGDNITQEEYYWAVGFICAVSVGCVGIIALLVYKKRRSGTYELTENTFDPDSFIRSQSNPSGSNGGGGVLKEVPSLQIESVDDDGTVHVTEYAVEDIPIFVDANDVRENSFSSV